MTFFQKEQALTGTAIEREHTIEAIGRTRDRTRLHLVFAAKGDRNAGVRARVAETLGLVPSRGSRRVLLELLADRDEMVRLNAAEALGLLRAKSALSALAERLRTDRAELVRAYCAEAIGHLHIPETRQMLATVLQRDKSSAVRLRVLEALYRMGERRRWMEILPFLSDDDYHVRSAASGVLEDLLSPTRRDPILTALEDQLRIEPTVAVADRLRAILAKQRSPALRKRKTPAQSIR